MERKLHIRRYQSPCGILLLGAMGGWLYVCDWAGSPRCMPELERMAQSLDAVIADADDTTVSNKVDRAVIDRAAEQLGEYFAGRRREFDLPVEIVGTDLQRVVREYLMTIPYGDTVTYTQVGEAVGRPSAVRAVANAIGSNPLSIIVPCHRVVASDGSLGGYRGGLIAKDYLLELEAGVMSDRQPQPPIIIHI